MVPAVVAAHWHDATVAAAEAASHDALDRHLARTAVACGYRRCRSQHAFGAAGVHHDWRIRRTGGQSPFERRHNAAVFAGAAVFGRQHEIDVEVTKQIQAEQFLNTTSAVEERGSDAARA